MPISAQIIMERTQIAPNSPIKTKPIFDDQNYTKLWDESGQKIYVPSQQVDQNAPDNVEEDVTLTLNLLFDPSIYTGPFLIYIYDENGFRTFAFAFGANTATINLPPGTYDIFSNFKKGATDYFVIKESMEIHDNITIEVSVTEAVNYISSLAFNETGEILEPGIYNPETETIEGGNAHMLFKNIIRFQPDNYSVIDYQYIWDTMQSEGEEPIWNFYINTLSDRYTLIQNVVAMGYEGNSYVSKYNTLSGISGSILREVGPEDWSFHHEFFQASLLGESQGINYPGLMVVSTYENYVDGGWTSFRTDMNADEGITVYLNNSFDGDPVDFLVFPAIVDHLAAMTPFGDEGFFLGGNAVIKGADGEILYGSGNTYPSFYFLGYDYYMTGGLGWKILPFHPKFTFLASENPDIIQGNNTPVSVTATVGMPEILWKGRYGEGRESDLFSMNVETKQDGNLIFSGSYMEFRDTAFPENGQIEVTFTNANIVVDGMEGKNTTTISYNASEGDNPPTMQMLQFRNTSEKVTDRFNSASEGTVRMAAADFQYNWDSASYDYAEGNTVEFYYSLYNQNEWTELELTEYPEHLQPIAFGEYYEGSLENVYVPEENSWFDVRIVCTDIAGNKQEQVVSPAFKVEQATMGVEETNKSSFTVYPNPFTNELNIQLPENIKGSYNFKVVDLSGLIIFSEYSKSENKFVWNGSDLPKGIYILSIESDGKVLTKKVIRK